ncbi:NDMA-dependent alcohol dehydrogenase [Pseudonocardia sp. KRD-184]|uniref:NDMA-dependent alcohol dehydrogenase n=1 Tax=Pseudonocardia oceani TaxID=2792013 RepID=A0ABS6UCS0_9PSEU|nr:NDMA-dependent alcohol dehydrogenase [Pseudonocardia oceani]MBW0092582.1 NDMA-dependent alcohol dehydrogenase [Pseudonocardia oceani]MBW0097277.1 NDMA-dependent alcohol dehydrogenase [Pseudonocardia oceani]MBW0107897.1 NDMA-dependent alcohol dehydrogenase [Pseudonocardia oceani]MBW0121271.1 NDMA-dependent alcohol dehydrogenase [Pseudonocardia oceani]MBW0129964.1 NDMA-dependent alcohol dehydrogenase [Pseudonocardia oceani]
MQTRGAIVRQAPGKYEVVDLEVDDPRPGEVQVKLVASGLCHSDDHIATGDIPVGVYPFAGGHEGAGIVTAAPPNHKGIKEGDHVVFSFLPSCGHCRWCASGQQNLCDLGAGLLAGSRWEDTSSFRLKLAGSDTPVGQMCGISTFVETTTVSADSVVKVDSDLPLDKICLLGCNVGTGWGSAVNSAEVQPGHTVIVMGIGGVGINAVQGAAHAGAANIIAVDPVALKRENATQLGATHGVETMEEATELAKQFTNGQGADSAIITVGVIKPEYVGQAMASIRKAGTVVVTALGNIADTTPLPVSLADVTLFQKRIQGSLFGESNPNWDIKRQVELYRAGVLKLDEVITTTYSLDQIGEGYEAMHAGTNQKGVIVYS